MRYKDRAELIILALPRGGVPVAFEVARALRAQRDLFLVRKRGVPSQEELALGAIASGNTLVRNPGREAKRPRPIRRESSRFMLTV